MLSRIRRNETPLLLRLQSASHNLEFGISLLNSAGSRKDDYDLSLALHNDASKVEYSKSNFEQVDILVAAMYCITKIPGVFMIHQGLVYHESILYQQDTK